MTTSYLAIPHMHVKRANALATPYLVNATPVFAAAMFAHGLSVSVTPRLKHVGTAYVHHDAQILMDRLPNFRNNGYFEASHLSLMKGACMTTTGSGNKGEYDSKAFARRQPVIATQPHALAHLEISLIVAFEGTRPPVSAVADEVARRRLAGGHIVDFGKVRYCNTLSEAYSAIDSGHILLDKSDLLAGKHDKVNSLIESCRRGSTETWCMPTVLGYATLTPFSNRKGVRNIPGTDKVPLHAYAEPLVAPVQFRAFRRSTINSISLSETLWHYAWLGTDVFAITQRQNKQEATNGN
ncbi:MAG: CRISPR type I-f/ypest-associated protein csy2 [Nitrospirae bacterium]|nr:MAG: CRISPR type I-f/ypest-associated protein csy2 [Nitrospirota bacterium]